MIVVAGAKLLSWKFSKVYDLTYLDTGIEGMCAALKEFALQAFSIMYMGIRCPKQVKCFGPLLRQ